MVKIKIREKRMSSYVNRGKMLIAEGKTPEAMGLIEKGLQYYSENVINAIYPYAKADAGLIVLVLRHLADEIEKGNAGTKELVEGMKNCVVMPQFVEIEKIKNPNMR